jgi:hypothetical protein
MLPFMRVWRIPLDGVGRKTTPTPRARVIEQCLELGSKCLVLTDMVFEGSAKLQGVSLASDKKQMLDSRHAKQAWPSSPNGVPVL